MNSYKKYFCASFMFCWFLLVPFGAVVLAAGTPSITHSTSVIPDFTFQIPINPGNLSIKGADITSGKAIALYINMIYPWMVAFAAVLAVIAFTCAGVLWLIAGGDAGKVTESKKIMGNALIGLLIALGSYTFLAVLGTDYVNFKPITVKPISNIALDLEKAEAELEELGGNADQKAVSVPVTGCPDNATITKLGKTFTKAMFGENWADILCHTKQSFFLTNRKTGTPEYDAGVDAHEETHGLNGQSGKLYIGKGEYLPYAESEKITLADVVKRLPSVLQNGDKGRFDDYLNTKTVDINKNVGPGGSYKGGVAVQNNHEPVLGVLDDFSAYDSNARVFAEIAEKNLPGKTMNESGAYYYGPPSFTVYGLALAKTLEEKDPGNLKDGMFKKTLKRLIEDGAKSYHTMERVAPGKIEPETKKMHDLLKTSSDASELRALAKRWYGADWTNTWLGF